MQKERKTLQFFYIFFLFFFSYFSFLIFHSSLAIAILSPRSSASLMCHCPLSEQEAQEQNLCLPPLTTFSGKIVYF